MLGPGVTRQRAALSRLQHALAAKPGAAGVVGPADIPAGQQGAHLLLARSGDAARYARRNVLQGALCVHAPPSEPAGLR